MLGIVLHMQELHKGGIGVSAGAELRCDSQAFGRMAGLSF